MADGTRQARGALGHARGIAAEAQVEQAYLRRGARCLERRWRGEGGEIDLIFSLGEDVVFVEVKASRTHAQAAGHLTPRQSARLMASAEAYLGSLPRGALTPMRIDVALVDDQGRIEIVENALMES
jgi:putative endonuclease